MVVVCLSKEARHHGASHLVYVVVTCDNSKLGLFDFLLQF